MYIIITPHLQLNSNYTTGARLGNLGYIKSFITFTQCSCDCNLIKLLRMLRTCGFLLGLYKATSLHASFQADSL